MSVTMITAGAGSGKTYKICEEILQHFNNNPDWQPENLIVTTFTDKAANELRERITAKLMEAGDFNRVSALSEAYIGTVHSICLRLLKKYGYLINLSPALGTLPEGEDLQLISELLDKHNIDSLHKLELRLSQIDSLEKKNSYPGLINKIAELARINGLDAEALNLSSDISIKKYLEILGSPVKFDRTEFISLLKNQYDYFNPIKDNLKSKNKEFYENVAEVLKEYNRNNESTLSWNIYFKLLTELNKEHQSQVLTFQQYLASHYRWPAFQNDISEYIKEIFASSATILVEYQDLKQKLGVIDFADMEVKMLELMDNKNFVREFSAQIKLILVDEFQDTSPLQLKIFNKWSENAGETIWVGDIKQSIYGFRGADASLVQTVMDNLPDSKKIPLPNSYRSRKELVDAANTIFTRAFHPMDPKYIKLQPHANVQDGNGMKDDTIYSISLEKKNFHENLANCVKSLLSEEWLVYDKETEDYRTVAPSDICVLLRGEGQNKNISNVRRSLMAIDIPVAQKGSLFLEQPEVYFITSILRYLVNQSDEHAIAKILYFCARKPDAQKLINHRIRFKINQRDPEFDKRYSHGSPFIEKLNELTNLTKQLSLEQLLETIFYRTGFQSMTGRWGRPESIRQSINRMIGLAAEYSSSCTRLNQIESIYGFLRFLDNTASGNSKDELIGEGVNVMTYHKAKGLEWPVVFIASMGNSAKGNVFSPRAITKDGSGLFEGRMIHYWPWPYHNKVSTSHLNNLFEPENEKVLKINREEEKRLIYVGFTRARDYLFLVTEENNYNWFEETCGKDWQSGINIVNAEFMAGGKENANRNVTIVKKRRPALIIPLENYFLAPSRDPMEVNFTLNEPERLGAYKPLLGKPSKDEESVLGDLFHHYLAVRKNAAGLIESFEMAKIIDAQYLEDSFERLKTWVGTKWPEAIWHAEWPLTLYFDGHMIQGTADLVLEMPEYLVLIDHKSFPGAGNDLHKHITDKKYPGQLAWYKKTLEETEKKRVEAVYVHFPVSSAMVKLELKY